MHEKISVHSVCFSGATLPEVAGYWDELRPQRVSFTGPLVMSDPSAARDVLDAGGYVTETITHQFIPNGHVEPQEESWSEPRANLTRMIDAAELLGAHSIYLLTGGHGTSTWEEAAMNFSRAIAPCVDYADAAGVALLLENASLFYAHGHLAHSLRDVITLAEMAGIGVNIDIFGCWAEAGLRESIERAMPRCQLIQVSDYVYGDHSVPGRAVPGDGAIPLKRILDWALSAGYTGAFDLELIGPRINQEGRVEAVRRAAERVGELLHSLGA